MSRSFVWSWFVVVVLARPAISADGPAIQANAPAWEVSREKEEKLAQEEIAQGRYAEALKRYRMIDFENLSSIPVWDVKIRHLERIVSLGTTAVDSLARARSLRYFGKTSEAQEIYAQLSAKFPRSALLHCELAMAALEAGDSARASREVDAAAAIQADSAYVAAAQGALWQAQGEFAKAVAAYDEALKKNPYMGGLRQRWALASLGLGPQPGDILRQPEVRVGKVMYFAFAEREELALGFPWRLPSTPPAAEESPPLAKALRRLHCGDLEGAIADIAALRAQKFSRQLSNDNALALLAAGDPGGALTLTHEEERPSGGEPTGPAIGPLRASAGRPPVDPTKGPPQPPIPQPTQPPNPNRATAYTTFRREMAEDWLDGTAHIDQDADFKSAEDFQAKAGDVAYYWLVRDPNSVKTGDDGLKRSPLPVQIAKIWQLLDQSQAAPSLADADPLTAGATRPDAAALAKIRAQLTQERVDTLSIWSPAGVTDKPPPAVLEYRLELGELARLAMPRQRGLAQDRWTVREMARWEMHGDSRRVARIDFAMAKRLRELGNQPGVGRRQHHLVANDVFLSAAPDFPEAYFRVGQAAEMGWGRPIDKGAALEYYNSAVSQGYSPAKDHVERLVKAGAQTEEQVRMDKLVKEYGPLAEKIYEAEYGKKQQPVPSLVLPNVGPPKPKPTAVGDAIRREAERGNPTAQWLLGECLTDGGLPYWNAAPGIRLTYQPRPDEAFPWFSKSADQGNPSAAYRVGLAYFFGVGVAVDRGQAKERLAKAPPTDLVGLLFKHKLFD